MNVQWIRFLALGVLAVVLTGCAGTNFVRPADAELRLGTTTYKDVTARFGSPYREGSQVINEKQVKAISYAYASMGSAPAVQGTTPARAMGFYFENEVMVGKEFLSSFKEDSTYFEEELAKKVKKGQSRAEVLKLAGRPHGEYIGPMVADGIKGAYLYMYQHARGFELYQRKLLVSFDKSDRVVDVSFTTMGKF